VPFAADAIDLAGACCRTSHADSRQSPMTSDAAARSRRQSPFCLRSVFFALRLRCRRHDMPPSSSLTPIRYAATGCHRASAFVFARFLPHSRRPPPPPRRCRQPCIPPAPLSDERLRADAPPTEAGRQKPVARVLKTRPPPADAAIRLPGRHSVTAVASMLAISPMPAAI